MRLPLIKILPSNKETKFFQVQSSDKKEWYDVWHDVDHHWLCTCPHYYFRKVFCKHMKAVAEVMGIKDNIVYAEVC